MGVCSYVDKSKNKVGRMWECPDFFSINGKDVLIISPQEVKATKDGFHNGNNTAYLIEKYDNEKNKFKREKVECNRFWIRFLCTTNI